jgi:stage V sporulation protein B
VSSLTVVLFTVVQATSSILQGMHKQRIPMYTLIAGVACKIALNYTLVGTPGIDIHGAPISSIVCYSVSMIPNLICVIHFGKMKFNWSGWIIRPGIATACMGLVVWLMRAALPVSRLWTLVEVAVGVGVFIGVALAVKAITPAGLPGDAARKKVRRQSMKPSITVVSLGPGDPGLMTLQTADALRCAGS